MPLQLEAGAARVLLLPAVGGAVGGFTWHDEPVLRPTPDDAITTTEARRTASYPLIPYSNRIRDARLAFSGNVYALGRNFGERLRAQRVAEFRAMQRDLHDARRRPFDDDVLQLALHAATDA